MFDSDGDGLDMLKVKMIPTIVLIIKLTGSSPNMSLEFFTSFSFIQF